jgi:cell division protein FtsW
VISRRLVGGSTRRHRPDMLIIVFMGGLLLLGLTIIYAISPALTARMSGGQAVDQNAYMYRQLINLCLGVTSFALASIIPVDLWGKFSGKLLGMMMVLGTLPFVLQLTPFGICANGACRWLGYGDFSFQPAELMKFALVIFLAVFLAAKIKRGKVNDFKETLAPIGVILAVMSVIIIGLQKDLGTGLIIIAIVVTTLFVAGLSKRYLGMLLAACLAGGLMFVVIAPHRVERVLTFVNHSSVTQDTMGYHINQALIAVGSGGLMGKGLGQSIQAFGYLPEAANDSIFAVMAEKLGFVGTVVVLVVFAMLFLRILGVMDHSQNTYYRLVAAGVFSWLFAHAIVNIGAMLGIFPLTGITLPFISLGGTSLIVLMGVVGVVFNISRYTTHSLSAESVGSPSAALPRQRQYSNNGGRL